MTKKRVKIFIKYKIFKVENFYTKMLKIFILDLRSLKYFERMDSYSKFSIRILHLFNESSKKIIKAFNILKKHNYFYGNIFYFCF